MVNSPQELSRISCICEGFSVFFSFFTSSDIKWLDYFSEIKFDEKDENYRVRSRKSFITVVDISRLAVYINQIVATGASDIRKAFVPLELGFELELFGFEVDSDYPVIEKGTMSIWIGRPYIEDVGFSAAGARGWVTSKELLRFSQQLQNLAKSVSQTPDV